MNEELSGITTLLVELKSNVDALTYTEKELTESVANLTRERDRLLIECAKARDTEFKKDREEIENERRSVSDEKNRIAYTLKEFEKEKERILQISEQNSRESLENSIVSRKLKESEEDLRKKVEIIS